MRINIYAPLESRGHKHFPFTAEQSGRLITLENAFEKVAKLNGVSAKIIRDITPASNEQLEAVHDKKYLESLSTRGDYGLIIGTALNLIKRDVQYYTRVSAGTFEAIKVATGSVIHAIEDTLSGKCNSAFCAVRPPGHHAGVRRGEGFCLVNNVAVGAYHALSLGQRVAIVDFDRHHGNGTMNIVASYPSEKIFFASSYQEGCKYSKTLEMQNGTDRIAFPIPKGSGISEVHDAYSQHVVTHLKNFGPDVLILSAGFDMHESDPLSEIKLHDKDYFDLTHQLMRAAQCPVVSVLEGGYDEQSLNRSVYEHLLALTH